MASPDNHDYLRGLSAGEVFDYHAADWVQQVRAAVPGGVDLLFDGAGGQARDQATGAVRDGGRAMLLGELITLRQHHLPVKIIVFNNDALSFVELEMKAAGE